ncbi:MAG: phage/plasmid primase, P4 family, partial [Phycisphaeraceae bacterium]
MSVSHSSSVPAIRLNLPNNPIEIDASSLIEACVNQLHAALSGETKPDSVTLVRPAQWTPGLFYVATNMLAAQSENTPIVVGDEQYDDMFTAALACVTSPANPTRHERSIANAIEAAAAIHPTAATTTAQQISDRVSEVGGKRTPASIRKQIEALTADGSEADEVEKASPQRLAELFLEHLGDSDGESPDRLVYSRAMGCFYIFGGDTWSEMTEEDILIRATTFLQEKDELNVTRALVSDVVANLRAICFVHDGNEPPPYWVTQRSPLELTRPRLAQFSNGLLHLGKLLGVDDDTDGIDLFECDTTFHPGSDIRFINTNVLPYDFDEEAECPGWLIFLDEILPRESCGDRRQELLQEFMGYTLLTGASPFEKMLITVGTGKNGKSSVLKIWEHMLGVHNVSNVSFDLLGKDALLRTMVGKAANTTRELEHVSRTHEAKLKQIISGEPLTIDRKYLDAMTLSIHAKLIVSCNSLPNFSDTTDGVWRRLIIMPFNIKIPDAEINPHLSDELLGELPGIFNWAAEGLQRLLTNGRFSDCEICDAKKGKYRREANTVAEFLDQCTRNHSSHAVTTKGLYATYKIFTERNGRHPLSNSYFGREIKRLGYDKKRVGSVLHP